MYKQEHVPSVFVHLTRVRMQEMLKKTYVQPSSLSAFLELHIEQGPLLEREGTDLGIVTAIAAPAALRVTFTGSGGHAGALLMPDRSPLCPLASSWPIH